MKNLVNKPNVFGWPIDAINVCLADAAARPLLTNALRTTLSELHIDTIKIEHVAKLLFDAADDSEALETDAKRSLRDFVSDTIVRQALDRRAALMCNQVRAFLVGDSLVDVGCGDGLVAQTLANQFVRTQLVDVINYLAPGVTLPFATYREGEPLPINEPADTTLLLTVLHHAGNPHELVRAVRRITRRRCIIIESVIGVVAPNGDTEERLASLPIHSQLHYATFVDWLYNRVIRTGVPVPYNFTTPDQWVREFETAGFSIVKAIDLGIDQPLVPEHHVLFVLDTP